MGNATDETLRQVRDALGPSVPVTGGGATSVVILDAPGALRSVSAQVAAAVAAGPVWLLVLDAAALPANGVVTSSVVGAVLVQHAAGGIEIASIDEVSGGTSCSAGAVVVLSSTGWSAGVCTLTAIASGLAAVNARVAP